MTLHLLIKCFIDWDLIHTWTLVELQFQLNATMIVGRKVNKDVSSESI